MTAPELAPLLPASIAALTLVACNDDDDDGLDSNGCPKDTVLVGIVCKCPPGGKANSERCPLEVDAGPRDASWWVDLAAVAGDGAVYRL